MEKDTQQVKMDLNPQVAAGIYSNLSLIAHSASEFVLDFARILPGMPQPEIAGRVILAPEHAKRLLLSLQENVMRYENTFGPIRFPEEEKNDMPPFSPLNGEA